jgi:HSP20 family protein
MPHLTHYQPWPLVNLWHSELDPLFNDSVSGSEPVVGNDGAWVPSVDVFEGSDCFLVRADIPGVTAKDIEVTADDCVLTIRGERKTNDSFANKGFASIERPAGAFMRRFTLPDRAQAAGITANYANGVLDVSIPKAPTAEAARISVTASRESAGPASERSVRRPAPERVGRPFEAIHAAEGVS